jgi:predicted negative regulator of RcsB-dependent stress response
MTETVMSGSYDFEEQERLAELKGWWEDNRWYVIGAVVLAVLAFGGWKAWQAWDARRTADAAALFRPVAEAKGDDKKAAEAAKVVIDRHPGSYYASESALLLAKQAFEAGNHAEARKHLEWVASKGVAAHRSVAKVRLAAVLLDEKKFDESLKALDGISDPSYAALAADLRGDVMLAQGRTDEARAAYKSAMEKAGDRNPLKQISQTKLEALGGAL